MKKAFLTLVVVIGLAVVGTVIYAGTLTAPVGTPVATSYTLDDIYHRLLTNTAATSGNHSLTPTTTPASTFHTLSEIYGLIPTIDATKVLTGTTYLGVAGSASAGGGLLKTGVTLCYDPSGATTNTVACAGAGQDGTYQSGTTPSYTNNGDTVTDNFTGLTWEKKTAGNYDDTMTWSAAVTYCTNLALDGQSDWRVPNIAELFSIVDRSRVNPAINPIFGDTSVENYWSSTPAASDVRRNWQISFYDGFLDYNNRGLAQRLRCVRG